jgi:hypothetical protein
VSLLFVHVSVVPTLIVTFLGLNFPWTMLIALTGAGGVCVALTVFALGVPLLPPEPSNLLSPRCTEQEESNKDSTMMTGSAVIRFIVFSLPPDNQQSYP